MVYIKTDWVASTAGPLESSPGATAITAERLDKLETQYDEVAADIGDGATPVGAALNSTYGPVSLDQAGPFLAKLELGVEDAGLLVMGDSTGADPAVETRWVRALVNELAARYPAYTVSLVNWVSATDVLAAPVTIQTGTGARTLTVHNISDSGAAALTFLNDFTARTPGTPDLIFISLGLNESVVSFTANYRKLVQAVRAKFPMAGTVLVAQNAKLPAAADASDQRIIRQRIARLAAREGLGLLDVASRFLDDANWESSLMLGGGDTVHPNQAGYTAWGQFAASRLVPSRNAPVNIPKASGDSIFIPASSFVPTTGTPVLASIADGLSGYAFDATTREVVSMSVFRTPPSWSKFNVYLYWTSANPGGSTGAVQWQLSTFPGLADRTTYPSARGSETIVGIIRTSETVPSTGESGFVRRLDWTAESANEFTARGPLMLAVARRGDNSANDTLGIDAIFLGLEFERVE